ncbi:MAG: hypothetical protein Q8Q07_07610 [Dehalococcoidales bacterium]|nr:hypothetical protein [Dehalococcoidales bacterium]
MLKIAAKTKLNPEDAIKRAVDFFGPKGYGLKVKQQNPDCASFEGGGGGVEISTCVEKGVTSVELESREWDNQVKEFITKIH